MTSYELKTFTDIYNRLSKQPLPLHFKEKAQYYNKTFNCFNSFYDPKMIWEKKKYSKKEKVPKNRFHIILHDFTKESQTKRQLTGYLNKLTSKNQSNIYDKLKDIIAHNNEDEYFNLVWSYVKTTDDDLYLKVLYFFQQDLMIRNIDQLWNSYVARKEWMPPDYILNNDILRLNDEYDMYCNYTKWKKETLNMNMAWVYLKKDVSILLQDVFLFFCEYVNGEKVYRHVVDILLEQIDKLLKQCNNDEIVEKIKNLDVNKFESSSRFIIYNILEKNK